MQAGLIINTRATLYHERFHEAFGDLPWAIFDCPLTRPEPVGFSIPSPDDFDALIFTSQAGVAIFPSDFRWLEKKVYAVGQGTADAALTTGYLKVVSTGLNIEHMRRALDQVGPMRALYPSADEISYDLPAEFPYIQRLVIYSMAPRTDLPVSIAKSALAGTPIVVPLFSRRAVSIMADILRSAGIDAGNSKITAVGMSANVFTVDSPPWQRQVAAEEPTMEAVVLRTAEVIEGL